MCLALPALVRQAGKMPQPLWDSDALLRRGALWRDADQVLTTRAMTRCALAGGWIVLAAGRSRTPVAAVDLPCPVGSLDDMEGNRAGLHRRAAAAAADLTPALSRDARQATVPGEPGGGGNRRWLTTPV